MIVKIKKMIAITSLLIATFSVADTWSVKAETNDPMTTNKTYYALSPSFEPMNKVSFPYSDARSWIGVGCNTDNDYWAFIGFNKANFTGGEWKNGRKYHFAKIKYDDVINTIYLFEPSDGRDFLNVGNSDKRAFVMKLKSSNTVITGVPWYKQGNVWFSYSMSGSANAIDEIFKKCEIGTAQGKSVTTSQKSLSEKSQRPPKKNGDWTLAIASFKSLENASSLILKLKTNDYPAYLITKNDLFKVYVGTGIQRKDAEVFKKKIKDDIDLDGFVVMY